MISDNVKTLFSVGSTVIYCSGAPRRLLRFALRTQAGTEASTFPTLCGHPVVGRSLPSSSRRLRTSTAFKASTSVSPSEHAELRNPRPVADWTSAFTDWEYPGSQGIGCNTINKNDSANLLSFLKELRSQFGAKGLLTAAVSTTGFVGADGNALKDFSPYAKYLNYLNLMTVRPGPGIPLRSRAHAVAFSTISGASLIRSLV